MAKTTLQILKQWFQNGKKPNQEQFWNWMDSYWHKDEKIPINAVDELNTILGNKADTEVIQTLIDELETLSSNVSKMELHGEFPDNEAALQSALQPGDLFSLPFDGQASRVAVVVDMYDAWLGHGALPADAQTIEAGMAIRQGGHSVIIIPPPESDGPEFIWIAIPAGETVKTKWEVSAFSSGSVNADDLILPPVLIDGYNVYMLNYATQFDNSIKLL